MQIGLDSTLALAARLEKVRRFAADPHFGVREIAWLAVRDAVAADALDAHCRASDLVNFKRPREYVFVREIPKSPVGKVLRRKLVAGEFDAMPAALPLPPVPPA